MLPPAPASAIGFKEWSFVCDSLVQGVQALILRKGGIHEGRGGFEWKHREFFLFPTWFHTQGEKLRWVPENAQRAFPPEEERTCVDVSGFATLEQVWKVTDWAAMEALAPLHIWTEEVVRERFAYDEESCLHVALVRAWRLSEVWTFPYSKSYGGCRSWVNLPEDGLARLPAAVPALSEAAWADYAGRVRAVLGA
ncbi:MAG: DUF1802 family protein [Prosthecobacter sp.]|jgi:hypothetical protein|nr:DUF1802 family protein [Prosthecobacter sp.]